MSYMPECCCEDGGYYEEECHGGYYRETHTLVTIVGWMDDPVYDVYRQWQMSIAAAQYSAAIQRQMLMQQMQRAQMDRIYGNPDIIIDRIMSSNQRMGADQYGRAHHIEQITEARRQRYLENNYGPRPDVDDSPYGQSRYEQSMQMSSQRSQMPQQPEYQGRYGNGLSRDESSSPYEMSESLHRRDMPPPPQQMSSNSSHYEMAESMQRPNLPPSRADYNRSYSGQGGMIESSTTTTTTTTTSTMTQQVDQYGHPIGPPMTEESGQQSGMQQINNMSSQHLLGAPSDGALQAGMANMRLGEYSTSKKGKEKSRSSKDKIRSSRNRSNRGDTETLAERTGVSTADMLGQNAGLLMATPEQQQQFYSSQPGLGGQMVPPGQSQGMAAPQQGMAMPSGPSFTSAADRPGDIPPWGRPPAGPPAVEASRSEKKPKKSSSSKDSKDEGKDKKKKKKSGWLRG